MRPKGKGGKRGRKTVGEEGESLWEKTENDGERKTVGDRRGSERKHHACARMLVQACVCKHACASIREQSFLSKHAGDKGFGLTS
jgi:hypothetical protein